MTNILELLKNEKVEWKKLGEVADIQRGRVISKKYLEEHSGEYPVYSSQTQNDGVIGRIDTYDFDGEYITWTTDGAYAGTVFYRLGKFSITNICGLIKPKDELLIKYLFYWLQIEAKKHVASGSGNPKLMSNVVVKIKIPIPSLEIQGKIVNILDKLTNYIFELQSELQLRTNQYTYYRDKLLSEEYLTKVTKEMGEDRKVEIVSLGDIGKISMCKRILKNQTFSEGDIPFYKIGTFGKKADAYISSDLFEEYKENYSYPKKGEILLSASGTIGRTIIFNGEDSYYQDSNIVWLSHNEDKILNSYLYYCYQIINWNPSTGGTIKRLYNYNLININIVVPPLHVQQHVVAILDKFDTLVDDIKEGLPKEIEQRQKQYEYWRSVLLTFK